MRPTTYTNVLRVMNQVNLVVSTNRLLKNPKPPNFRSELEKLINIHSQENNSDTPDFILAEYLTDSLKAFDKATNARDRWYSLDRVVSLSKVVKK